MKKNIYCPVLWMHLHVINDGRAFPCCMTPLTDENSFGNVNEIPLLEIMNSDKAKEMRVAMMDDNILPASCHRCTEKEEVGLNSMRTGMVDKYLPHIQDKIANTHADGTIDSVELIYWDFRFSNYCNLSCRTCSPMFSTAWDKDAKLMWNSTSDNSPLINLENKSIFWDDLAHQIKYVKSIHFAGGEPIIMEEHWKLIDMLIENNLTDIELRYSTNATVLTYKGRNILDIWKKFKYVHLSLSIDGVTNAFNYVRNKGNWDIVEKNLLMISAANLQYWIHPTISILNIYRLTEMHDKLLELGIIKNENNYFVSQFHMNPLFTPEYFCLTSLPDHHKVEIEKMLLEYAERMFINYGIKKDGWISLINFMNAGDTSGHWDKFISMTNRLDNIRKQSFITINPEFKKDWHD